MDPDANLAEQLRLTQLILDLTDPDLQAMHARRLSELVRVLHEWIRKGGRLPKAWNHGTVILP